MPANEISGEVALQLKALLKEGNQAAGGLLSAATLGVAGGAGAVYAMDHHGKVKATPAAHRRNG